MQNSTYIVTCATAVLYLSQPALAEPPNRASLLAHSCFSCHGHEGAGALKIPKLQGVDAKDLEATMHGFKAGTEKSTIMERHAKAYTDEEIALLADYFSRATQEKR